MEREIFVRGSGEAKVPPDRAVIQVTIDAEGASREAAYKAASESARQVDQVLSDHDTAIERVTAAALVVHPKTRWKKGESIRTGWRAYRSSHVEVTDFAQLGQMLAEMTAARGTISGPNWRVDPTNPAHHQVRAEAAGEARRRAEAYASGLGLTLGEVRWMSEPGLRDTSGSGDGPMPMGAIARSAAVPGGVREEDVIDVTPADITIRAEIEVSFALQAG